MAREGLNDPALAGVSITVSEVRASPDLRNATVYCAPLADTNHEAVTAALNRAAGYLRRQLGRHLEMKFTPALTFVHDDSFQAASDLDALLHRPDVARDLKSD